MIKPKIDKEHYNPLNDLLFSKYMSEKGCEEILLSFLKALFNEFDKEIDSVKLIENKSIKSQYIGGKDCIVDLRAETETGERIIMEMQQTDSNEFRKRSLTYIFREYSNSPRKSTEYNYKPHTLIAITDFKF
jgi:predicted transposase/invertase (TIGR01784 family)